MPSVVSVFAGRIADTGRDPQPIMRQSLTLLAGQPKAELLWASVREVLNIFQADDCGCHIVTVPHDILAKAMKLVGSTWPAFLWIRSRCLRRTRRLPVSRSEPRKQPAVARTEMGDQAEWRRPIG